MNGTLAKPTTGQMNKIREMIAEFVAVDADAAEVWRTELNLARERGQFDQEAASAAIRDLGVAKRNAAQAKLPVKKFERPEVPAGRYAIRDLIDTDVVHFYVVEVSDTGFYTVYAQASSDLHELPWGPSRAALKKIQADPKAASILYGKEKGVCGRCGAELTSKWRLQGIGPDCVKKF